MKLPQYEKYKSRVESLGKLLIEWFRSHCSEERTQNLRQILDRLISDRVLLGILGRQGAGKSTLGNVLLGQAVFPMDVKETTSLLTYVSGIPETEPEYSIITFQDGRQERGPLEDAFLRDYVDQNKNPGNSKGVCEVHCFAQVPWLARNGVTLVDTPGVNSINRSNHQLTIEMLPRLTGAVILFSINPTIQNDEKLFLEQIWDFKPFSFFIQNSWSEKPEDQEEGTAENLKILQRIASEGQSGGDDSLSLHTIQVQDAFNAHFESDEMLLEASGFNRFYDDLSSFLDNHLLRCRLGGVIEAIHNQILTEVDERENKIALLKENIKLTAVQVKADEQEKRDLLIGWMTDLKRLLTKTRTEAESFEDSFKSEFQVKLDKAKNTINDYISKGSVSPATFEETFQLVIKNNLRPPFDDQPARDLMQNLVADITEMIIQLRLKFAVVTNKNLGTDSPNRLRNDFAARPGKVPEYWWRGAAGGAMEKLGIAGLLAGLLAWNPVTAGIAVAAYIIGWLLRGSAESNEQQEMRKASQNARSKIAEIVTSKIRELVAKILEEIDELEKRAISTGEDLLQKSLDAVEDLSKPLAEQEKNRQALENELKELLPHAQQLNSLLKEVNSDHETS